MAKNYVTATCAGKTELESKKAQWVHLLPLGAIDARDNRRWQMSDPEKVIHLSLSDNDGLPVDYEHQGERSNSNGQPAPAAGWIKKLEVRQDGVWGYIEWTKKAAKMIADKEYRFISPVIYYDGQTLEVYKILGAGLTNTPALKLTALAKRENATMDNILSEIISALNLDENANEDDVLNAVLSAVEQAKNPDPAKFVPIAQVEKMMSETGVSQASLQSEQIERRVSEAIQAGTMPPSLREWGISLCSSNPDAFNDFVSRTGTPYAHLFKNSHVGESVDLKSTSPTGVEAALCKQLDLTPKDFIGS